MDIVKEVLRILNTPCYELTNQRVSELEIVNITTRLIPWIENIDYVERVKPTVKADLLIWSVYPCTKTKNIYCDKVYDVVKDFVEGKLKKEEAVILLEAIVARLMQCRNLMR